MMIRLGTVLALYLLNLPFADSLFVVGLSLPLFAIVIVGLGRLRSRDFEIGDIFWFCLFIYFVISPLQRIHGDRIGGATAITAYAYDPAEYALAMLVVVVFAFPFLFVSMQSDEQPAATDVRPAIPFILFLNVVAFILFAMSEGGFERLLSSRLEQDGSQPFIASMLFLAVQSASACLVAAYCRLSPRRLTAVSMLLLVLVLLAVARNPFNAPRFVLLAVWGPVFLALAGGKLSAAKFYLCGLVALTILFPILNITTRSGLEGLQDLSQVSVVGNFFDIPSVDVFDMAVHSVRYMSTHDLMWGEKLTAVVLFFVPRAVWPGKPIVGGLDIGNDLFAAGMYGTPNLSLFLGCDFYMDFGFVGVVLGGFACAFLLGAMIRFNQDRFFGVRVLQFFIAASLPILLRGPVGAVLPLFVCQLFVAKLLSVSLRRFVQPPAQLAAVRAWRR
ncbi:hypothetical protein FHT76_003800 [Rhizobium sp. BK176]|nr:hypothetical protein [Rhizobium sp. BK176]